MFTGNEDQTITLTEAAALTKNYRNAQPSGSNPILGHYFGKKILNDILAQQDCVGIRVYYALNASGEKELVLSGVYANGNDISNGVLGDRSFKSPPYSGVANPLNS